MDLPKPLRGIVVPLATPLQSRDRLDAAGLERLIEHVIEGGVAGLFILGTTGEGPSLSAAVRREMIERTCRQVRGRVPVMVGITDTSIPEALLLAGHAADAEAQAVVYAGPCYFPVSQPDLREHVWSLAGQLPLPLFLYNIPAHTRIAFAVETVLRLAGHPNIAGVKDSSGDMQYFHRLCAALPAGRTLLMGPEELLADAMLLGAHGGVNGGANMFPDLYVRLYRAAASARLLEVQELHRAVMRISEAIYEPIGYLRGLKCALGLLGICRDAVAEPLRPLADHERELIRAGLSAVGSMPA